MTADESWRNELTAAGTLRKRPYRKHGPKWEPKNVEIHYHVVSDEEYQQRLSELAEVLYDYFVKISDESPQH